MRSTYITATIIAIVLIAWLVSGQLIEDPTPLSPSIADQNREQERVEADAAPTQVRVTVIDASEQARYVKVRGRTENKRTVVAKVELSGTITQRPIERGTQVKQGELLCQISVEDRQASLIEAKEALNQARIEYQGALSLKQKGFNSQTAIAGAKARLAAAKANLSRRQLDLGKLKVTAPFDGIIEDVHQEVGDFVTPGQSCATVVDLDPMLLRGRVSEQDVMQLQLGQIATGILRNGTQVEGPLTFIGQQSDERTRTYAMEIELPNPDGNLRSGITTEILIPVETTLAQKVSPALFALSDSGELGVRTINGNNIVEFHTINLLSDADDGVWVTGLPNRASVITVGQELVTAGERVDPIFSGQTTMPAQTQPSNSGTNSSDTTELEFNPQAPDSSAVTHGLSTHLGAN